MPRQGNPDFVVDADRGSGTLATKAAEIVDADSAADRVETRGGLRELDAMTEGLPGLTRQQRDRERILPRGTVGELGHPKMQRPLPAAEDERVPFSSRQKKARSKSRLAAQTALPTAQYEAQRDLVVSARRWRGTNDSLSRYAGDIQELPDRELQQIKRVDRSIQTYEKHNDRGHVIYANVAMPAQINHSNLEGFVANNFQAGDQVAFDRYTIGTHQLHETSKHAAGDTGGRVAVFEIQTRRGAYLGHSDSRDDTSHLLPRGMEFEVLGTHPAVYRRPDGTTGSRTVIQLRDTTPEPDTSTGGNHD